YDSAASAGYDSAASAGYDHAHTAAGEPGGGWARAAAESTTWSEPASPDLPPDEPTGEAPNEVELPVPDELLGGLDAFPSDASPWPEPDLGFGGSDFAGLDEAEDADLDPYAQRGDERAVLSLGDIGLDAPPRRRDDDLFDEVVERTHAELTLDLPRDWEDDENTEVTEVVTRGNRPAAAAVQIHADGTAHVVGTDEPDDPSLASAIELGDESSQADVRLDPIDGITGSFSISRLGLHDDDDDEDDVESVSVEGVSAIIHAAIPDPTRIRDWIAEADLTASRDTRQAILLYGDVIDAEPGNLRALVARGRLYLDRGDYTRAASDFLKAEARAPSNVDVQVSLGDLFFARKEYGRATAYFDTAVQTDPGNATAWYRRGLTRYYRREFQPALDDLERARKLDAGLPSIDSFIDKARRRQL
ncbi:MAG TPA: tetratricopeptide repeat protein, partial [Myxococcota bacterium]|nr:tetratricopeptide repeat protein [Myxococcota bacterium]